MRKLALILALAMYLTGCITVDKINPATSGEYLNNSDKYELLNSMRAESVSKQVYFFFIPFGGKGELTMQNECYNEVLKQSGADGVFLPTYVITRKRYPFYCVTKTELSGRPYKIKLK